VRPGQTEAGLATGMRRWQVLRIIIIPQAAVAMVPVLLNQIIIILQDTALVYVVALTDFLTASSVIAQRDGRPIVIYTFLAVGYFIICLSLSKSVEFYKARGSK